MQNPQPLFARLRSDITTDCGRTGDQARIKCWADVEAALAGLDSTAAIFTACSDRVHPERARAILASLVRAAGEDPQAGRVVLGALCPELSHVGRALVRSWGAEPEEVDQALAAAAWVRITTLAGTRVHDPAAVIVGGARNEVRGQLRRGAERRHLPFDPFPVGQLHVLTVAPPDDAVEVAQLFATAVRRQVVSLDEARLVVRTRALGVSPTELARGSDQRPGTLRMRRHRAESALRAIA